MNDNEFFKEIRKKEDKKNEIDLEKINYNLGDITFKQDDLINAPTYQDWLLWHSVKPISKDEKLVKKIIELEKNHLGKYPIEYIECVARTILDFPFPDEEIKERYRIFKKQQRKEEKENLKADIEERKKNRKNNKILQRRTGEFILTFPS